MTLRTLLLVASGLVTMAPATAAPAAPDVIVTNARIYTVNPAQPWAEAVAITGDRIGQVG